MRLDSAELHAHNTHSTIRLEFTPAADPARFPVHGDYFPVVHNRTASEGSVARAEHTEEAEERDGNQYPHSSTWVEGMIGTWPGRAASAELTPPAPGAVPSG